MKLRNPDFISIFSENGNARQSGERVVLGDASACTEQTGSSLVLKVTAQTSPLRYVRVRWNFTDEEKRDKPVRVLGDEWERGYGQMEWRGIMAERCMPWVCMVSDGSDLDRCTADRFTECFGVKTRASALCFWQYDGNGVTLWADIRNGGSGVQLNGRVLTACEIVFGEYRGVSAFRAIGSFYKGLNDRVLTTDHRVYGSNNWYYAYGSSSHEQICSDTELVADLCRGLENKPYMVIDDGWEPNSLDGPWDRGNERFPDMKGLAEEIKKRGARPGIWVRYLSDAHYALKDIPEGCRLSRDDHYLDPSHPYVLDMTARITRRFSEQWGYQLIKHDFSTFDVFGFWGFQRPETLTDDGWHFFDRTKTGAEIIVNFYRTIYESAAPGTVIIGCNTIGHLTAGLAHLNRVGDDTSGLFWERTRKYGVNTLAFRLVHDKAFYAADSDCVGITGRYPLRPLNSEWMRALSVSGTPLFISCKPGILNEDELKELSEAYARASVSAPCELEPLDWMETTCPERWLLNGEEIRFDWYPEDGDTGFWPDQR